MELALNRKRLDFIFPCCLILTLIIPSIFPTARLLFFSPFLIVACYKQNLTYSLWIALGCGLIMDFFSSNLRLGIHSLNYCITLIMLYPQKKNFFADSVSTLPIMTFLFSSISTLIMAILLYSLEMKNVLSWYWALTDLILMPVVDAIYAFGCYILPALLFGKPRRRGADYFLSE
jgi:rod shape-determining protein MreD